MTDPQRLILGIPWYLQAALALAQQEYKTILVKSAYWRCGIGKSLRQWPVGPLESSLGYGLLLP